MGSHLGSDCFFFFKVDVTIFSDLESIKPVWFGKICVLASTVLEAREKALIMVKDVPEVKEKIQHLSNPSYRIYEINRSRQVFKKSGNFSKKEDYFQNITLS